MIKKNCLSFILQGHLITKKFLFGTGYINIKLVAIA